jgi:hypothetical protein
MSREPEVGNGELIALRVPLRLARWGGRQGERLFGRLQRRCQGKRQ